MPKILFTSPYKPYPKKSLKNDPIDYFYYRNTLGQKMFQLRSFQSWHSLHLLAQNISVPSVVLENPTFSCLKNEIIINNYDIVAIGFTLVLTHKVLKMVEWIKNYNNNIIIILGGYGTTIFKEDFEISTKLKNLVDYICYGEGISFIRNFLLEKYKISANKEIIQSLIPSKNSFFRTKIKLFEQIIVVSGLGCVYGCSFCATSSQFNQKYISLFSGKKLFETLLEQSNKYPKIQSAIIYDEDFLINKSAVLEFMEYFYNSELYQKTFLQSSLPQQNGQGEILLPKD